MIPKLRVVRRRAARRRATRAHPRRPHPARAAARVLHPRGHRHDDRRQASEHDAPSSQLVRRHPGARRRARHADLRPAPGRVRARRGREAVGQRGQGVPRLPRRPRGHVARPRAPGGGRRARRPGPHAAARVEPLLQRVQPQVAARLDALLGGGGQVFFANSGAEANECAIKLARRYGQANGGPERFHVLSACGSFHGRTLTTLAATGQPQKQETFQPLPDGLPPGGVRRPRRARGGDGRAGVRGDARADPGRGRRAAVAARATSKACARCATSARRC